MKLIPRRTFLATLGASSAASAALASAAPKAERLPRSLDSQLEDCIAQLRDILEQMHPEVTSVDDYFRRHEYGTFRLSIRGHRRFEDYKGPGVYLVSEREYLMEYYLERFEHCNVSTGEPLKGCFYFEAVMCLNCMPVGEVLTLNSPQIVRKLADTMYCSDLSIEV